MQQKILVLAYPGSGKTYLADNYKNVSDFEFQHYRYDYGGNKHLPLEQLKGRTEIRTIKPEWPKNFAEALKNELQNRKIVLIPFVTYLVDVLDYLPVKDIRIIFAIQTKESFEQLADNFKSRGNSEEFIERRQNDFEECHNLISESKFEKVFIKEHEFLKEALERTNIKLEKGKGTRNYI